MNKKIIEKDKIEDTYAEAFAGVYCRVIVTADNEETLEEAVKGATALPSEVIGRLEGGIEKWLPKEETLDKRKGAVLQFWKGLDRTKPLKKLIGSFEIELSYRIRQGIMVKPLTSVFDALTVNAEGKIDTMETVGHCGDAYEWEEQRSGRKMIVVPIMVPDFLIERHIGYAKGVSGGNFWYMCSTKEAMFEAGKRALKVISQIEGVITPFGICSAGSKIGTRFPQIGPTTNHPYCPSLKQRLGNESRVPEGVYYIPEIVINGISIESVREAMRAGIEAVLTVKDVLRISAGSYGGDLGDYKIHLYDLFP